MTEAITEDALEFLDTRRDQKQPFYLHVAYTAPHAPWLNNHPKEYTDLYKDCPFESVPHLPRHPDSIYLTDEVAKDERGNLIGYFAAVTAMDAGIGKIGRYGNRRGYSGCIYGRQWLLLRPPWLLGKRQRHLPLKYV